MSASVGNEFDKIGTCLKELIESGILGEDCTNQIRRFIGGKIKLRTNGAYQILGAGSMDELIDDIFQESMLSLLEHKEKFLNVPSTAIASYFSKIVISRIEDVRRNKNDAASLNEKIQVSDSDDPDEVELLDILSYENTDSEDPYCELVAQDIFLSFKEFVANHVDLCDFLYNFYGKPIVLRDYSSRDARYKAHQRARDRVRGFFSEIVDVTPCVIKKVIQLYMSEICEKLVLDNEH